MPPLLLLISLYFWADTVLCGVSLWSVWFSCHFPRTFPTGRGGQGLGLEFWRDSICAAGALLSSSQNTAVLLFELPVQCTGLWGLLQGKITASQPDPRHRVQGLLFFWMACIVFQCGVKGHIYMYLSIYLYIYMYIWLTCFLRFLGWFCPLWIKTAATTDKNRWDPITQQWHWLYSD